MIQAKQIALTFDDGPNEPYTSKLLDVLKKNGVKATFFLVGRNVEKSPNVAKRIVDDGHVIGNHLYSHNFLNYFLHPTMAKEIRGTQDIIAEATGKKPALIRTPWLFRHPLIDREIRQIGLTFVSGTFGYEFEIFQPEAERIARRALSKAYPGCTMIFHDGFDARGGSRRETVGAIDIIIPRLLELGYNLVTADKLLGVPAYLE